jgi:hypothetical protein
MIEISRPQRPIENPNREIKAATSRLFIDGFRQVLSHEPRSHQRRAHAGSIGRWQWLNATTSHGFSVSLPAGLAKPQGNVPAMIVCSASTTRGLAASRSVSAPQTGARRAPGGQPAVAIPHSAKSAGRPSAQIELDPNTSSCGSVSPFGPEPIEVTSTPVAAAGAAQGRQPQSHDRGFAHIPSQ